MVNRWDRCDSVAATYSGGMKRRLEIARGLPHAPLVLFLDDPTLDHPTLDDPTLGLVPQDQVLGLGIRQ